MASGQRPTSGTRTNRRPPKGERAQERPGQRPPGGRRPALGQEGRQRPPQEGNRKRRPPSGENRRPRQREYGYREEPVKKKKGKGKMIALGIVIFLIFILMFFVLYVITKLGKIQNIDIDENNLKIDEKVQANESLKGYKNIALFGVDSRDGTLGKGTRTDTIMIASLNEDTGDIKLLSIFRDTYLNLGNDVYDKANAAYANGGPEQAIQMLNMNLDMNITDYVTADFTALSDVIDALGGIPIDVQDEEIVHLNNYQIETAKVAGKKIEKITAPGLQTLNGVQATSYARIRYTAGDDFKRAERQRTVLTEIAKKAKEADVVTLNKIINSVFPKIATSFTTSELISYAAGVIKYNIADTSGFPFDRRTGEIGSKGDCVVADDLTGNVKKAHEFFFGTTGEGYLPSETVKTLNEKIKNDTAQYLR